MAVFDDYDTEKLKKAFDLLNEVYDYNYGAINSKQAINKLGTIINKLSNLIEEQKVEIKKWNKKK